MKRIILLLMLGLMPCSGFASDLPTEPRTQELLQPGTTYALELGKIIEAIMKSNLDPAAMERVVKVSTDGILALQQKEIDLLIGEQEQKGSLWGSFFKILGQILTLGAATLAAVKATT